MRKAKKILITTTTDEVLIVRHGRASFSRGHCPLCGSEPGSAEAAANGISAAVSGTDLGKIVDSPVTRGHRCDTGDVADKNQKGEKR